MTSLPVPALPLIYPVSTGRCGWWCQDVPYSNRRALTTHLVIIATVVVNIWSVTGSNVGSCYYICHLQALRITAPPTTPTTHHVHTLPTLPTT